MVSSSSAPNESMDNPKMVRHYLGSSHIAYPEVLDGVAVQLCDDWDSMEQIRDNIDSAELKGLGVQHIGDRLVVLYNLRRTIPNVPIEVALKYQQVSSTIFASMLREEVLQCTTLDRQFVEPVVSALLRHFMNFEQLSLATDSDFAQCGEVFKKKGRRICVARHLARVLRQEDLDSPPSRGVSPNRVGDTSSIAASTPQRTEDNTPSKLPAWAGSGQVNANGRLDFFGNGEGNDNSGTHGASESGGDVGPTDLQRNRSASIVVPASNRTPKRQMKELDEEPAEGEQEDEPSAIPQLREDDDSAAAPQEQAPSSHLAPRDAESLGRESDRSVSPSRKPLLQCAHCGRWFPRLVWKLHVPLCEYNPETNPRSSSAAAGGGVYSQMPPDFVPDRPYTAPLVDGNGETGYLHQTAATQTGLNHSAVQLAGTAAPIDPPAYWVRQENTNDSAATNGSGNGSGFVSRHDQKILARSTADLSMLIPQEEMKRMWLEVFSEGVIEIAAGEFVSRNLVSQEERAEAARFEDIFHEMLIAFLDERIVILEDQEMKAREEVIRLRANTAFVATREFDARGEVESEERSAFNKIYEAAVHEGEMIGLNAAAVKIQKIQRGSFARKEAQQRRESKVLEAEQKRADAIVTIQKTMRGSLGRMSVSSKRESLAKDRARREEIEMEAEKALREQENAAEAAAEAAAAEKRAEDELQAARDQALDDRLSILQQLFSQDTEAQLTHAVRVYDAYFVGNTIPSELKHVLLTAPNPSTFVERIEGVIDPADKPSEEFCEWELMKVYLAALKCARWEESAWVKDEKMAELLLHSDPVTERRQGTEVNESLERQILHNSLLETMPGSKDEQDAAAMRIQNAARQRAARQDVERRRRSKSDSVEQTTVDQEREIAAQMVQGAARKKLTHDESQRRLESSTEEPDAKSQEAEMAARMVQGAARNKKTRNEAQKEIAAKKSSSSNDLEAASGAADDQEADMAALMIQKAARQRHAREEVNKRRVAKGLPPKTVSTFSDAPAPAPASEATEAPPPKSPMKKVMFT